MLTDNALLLAVLVLGLVFNNRLISSAAAIVLVVQLTRVGPVASLLERRALEFGLILLTVATLAPMAGGKITWRQLAESLFTPVGLAAVIGGALAAQISRPGVELLQARPEVVLGLMVGTILGIVFLHGIPVGPLVASGLAAVILALIRYRL